MAEREKTLDDFIRQWGELEAIAGEAGNPEDEIRFNAAQWAGEILRATISRLERERDAATAAERERCALLERWITAAKTGVWRDLAGLSLEAHPLFDLTLDAIGKGPISPPVFGGPPP